MHCRLYRWTNHAQSHLYHDIQYRPRTLRVSRKNGYLGFVVQVIYGGPESTVPIRVRPSLVVPEFTSKLQSNISRKCHHGFKVNYLSGLTFLSKTD